MRIASLLCNFDFSSLLRETFHPSKNIEAAPTRLNTKPIIHACHLNSRRSTHTIDCAQPPRVPPPPPVAVMARLAGVEDDEVRDTVGVAELVVSAPGDSGGSGGSRSAPLSRQCLSV